MIRYYIFFINSKSDKKQLESDITNYVSQKRSKKIKKDQN